MLVKCDLHRSVQQELAHRRAVLQEQLAQLNLKHERYKELASLSEKAGADVEHILAGMEQRTKVFRCETPEPIQFIARCAALRMGTPERTNWSFQSDCISNCCLRCSLSGDRIHE